MSMVAAREATLADADRLVDVAQAAIASGNIREEHGNTVYFTDDRAPVEQLIDAIIFDAVTGDGNK